tara:strand:+ start:3882 stop:4481 length:600 start_codon:yes stop_codon:yes gene_type:complete
MALTLPGELRAEIPDRSVLLGLQLDLGWQSSDPMVTVYGNEDPVALQLRATWLFDEKFGVGIGIAGQFREGTGVAPVGEGSTTSLWQAPVFVEGVLRAAFIRKQIAVPYVRGGFDAVLWSEEDGEDDPNGLKWGVHMAGGVAFRLPFPELNWEGRLTGDSLLDEVYLHIEGWGRSASNFGSKGLDLSGAGFSVGLQFLL